MAVFRIEKTRDYTVMSNYHLRDRSLSLKAKGLLSLMLSLPEDWDYTMKGLARICKDGIDSISGGIRELETPVRELAADAGVNPNTMQRALQELESRGLLQAQRTAGRTVTADDTALQALRRRRAGTLAAEFLHQMQALGLTEAEIETLLRETAQQAQKKE